jgi:hypothetical protein
MPYDPDKYLHQPTDDELIRVGVDLDNTLAENVWPESDGIGQPIAVNVAKLREMVEAGLHPWIYTSRPDGHYKRIEEWLKDHDIPFYGIRTGKPMFKYYIDDRAINAEETTWLK